MLSALKDAYVAHARQSQGLLTVEMLRTSREDQSRAAVGGGTPVDSACGERHVQTAQRIHHLRKDVHIGDNIMVDVQAEIQIEGVRQKAWSIVGLAIGIGSVELLVVRFQVALDLGNP